jgi:hypothetical protein
MMEWWRKILQVTSYKLRVKNKSGLRKGAKGIMGKWNMNCWNNRIVEEREQE